MFEFEFEFEVEFDGRKETRKETRSTRTIFQQFIGKFQDERELSATISHSSIRLAKTFKSKYGW